uniref:DUF6449 domain-containing protein n=1 Tax=Acetatifactor sp. TaxID=1872090 RepID=UPI004057A0FC
MTSKNLFFKRMKQDLDQRIWLPVILFILGFLVTEMPLLSSLSNWHSRTDYIERAQRYLLQEFFTPNSVVTILTVFMALVCGISGYAYIHSAKKLDVFHSLPVKRETLFLQQYVYGILYYVVPVVAHVLLCLIICAANGVLNGAVLGNAIGFLLVQFIIFLVNYAVVILAVCLTGNLVISVLGSVILLVYTLLVEYLLFGSMSTFFATYYGSASEAGIPALSPVHMLYNMLMEMNDTYINYPRYMDYLKYYGIMLVAAAIYTLLASFLYKKRPTEMAGSTMVFPITEPVVKAMIVIPTSIVSGYLFTGIISYTDDFIWFVIGCLFGFAIICPLTEIIFRKDMKAILAHPLQLVFNGACVIVILLVLEFDLLGYDSYVPNEDKVESYAIAFGEVPTIRSDNGDINYTYRLEHMEIRDNESTRKLLEHAAEFTRPLRRGEFEQEILMDAVNTTYLDVRYNLKNGKTVYRSYLVNLADEQVEQWLGDTYNDMQHKMAAYPILTQENLKDYIGVMVDCAYGTDELRLSQEKMQKLIETYRRDLTNLQFEELMAEYPIANLSFALQDAELEPMYPMTEVTYTDVKETVTYITEDKFSHYVEEYGYRIYPSFTQTIALLKEYGAKFQTEIPLENVIEIRVTDYSREVNDHDGYYTKVAEKAYTVANGEIKEMEEILSNLVPGEFVEGFCSDLNTEPNIDVYIVYTQDDIEMSMYFMFKKGAMPQFVAEDLEEAYQEIKGAAQ